MGMQRKSMVMGMQRKSMVMGMQRKSMVMLKKGMVMGMLKKAMGMGMQRKSMVMGMLKKGMVTATVTEMITGMGTVGMDMFMTIQPPQPSDSTYQALHMNVADLSTQVVYL